MENRENHDIVEVISNYVDLEERGYGDRPYFIGLCPFHDDHQPSFIVYPNIQRFICYGCTPEYGDVVDFIARYKGISKAEAKLEASSVIAPAMALKRRLKGVQAIPYGMDALLFNLRIKALYRREGVLGSRKVVEKVIAFIKEKKFSLANSLLSERGV